MASLKDRAKHATRGVHLADLKERFGPIRQFKAAGQLPRQILKTQASKRLAKKISERARRARQNKRKFRSGGNRLV